MGMSMRHFLGANSNGVLYQQRRYHAWRTDPSARGNLTAWLESNTHSLACRLCERVREHWRQADDGWTSPLFQPQKVWLQPRVGFISARASGPGRVIVNVRHLARSRAPSQGSARVFEGPFPAIRTFGR